MTKTLRAMRSPPERCKERVKFEGQTLVIVPCRGCGQPYIQAWQRCPICREIKSSARLPPTARGAAAAPSTHSNGLGAAAQ